MEQILNVHSLSVAKQPIMNIHLMLILSVIRLISISIIIFIIILCITLYRKGKIIVFAWSIVLIMCFHIIRSFVHCIRSYLWNITILWWCVSFSILHNHSDFSVYNMILQDNFSCQCNLITFWCLRCIYLLPFF